MTALPDNSPANVHALSRRRMWIAMGVAVVADALQLMLGPLGFAFFDEIIDVIAALILWRLIGFHWLLLPTFVVELVPVVDMLPTWIACVLWVINLRKRQQKALTESHQPPPLPKVGN
jgi:hypothetical protein